MPAHAHGAPGEDLALALVAVLGALLLVLAVAGPGLVAVRPARRVRRRQDGCEEVGGLGGTVCSALVSRL